MSKLTLALLALGASLAATGGAVAQNWTSTQMGPYTFHNGTDSRGGSWNGTSTQLGPYRYDNFYGPNGQSRNCTTSQVGAYAYTNCN